MASRWSKQDIIRIAKFSPISLTYFGGNVTRAVIHGDMEGYPIDIHIDDSDIMTLDEGGRMIGIGGIEIGVFQYLLGQMQEHGILPLTRRKTENQETPANDSTAERKVKWTCPEHKDAGIYPAKFGTGLQCTRWQEVVDEHEDPPRWAQNKQSNVNGQYRWYCKFRETPVPPRR